MTNLKNSAIYSYTVISCWLPHYGVLWLCEEM